jgi:serine protease
MYKKIDLQKWDNPNRLVIAVSEGSGLTYLKNRSLKYNDLKIKPLFSRSPKDLHLDFLAYDIDLRRYAFIDGHPEEIQEIAKELYNDPKIQHLYYPNIPIPPPSDIPPTTDFFVPQQGYLDDFGISSAYKWLGGQGSNVQIANIEYGYNSEHEDLLSSPTEYAVGWPSGTWTFHGNGVLGIIIGSDNEYGVTGMSPQSSILMASPYVNEDEYNVAQIIDDTTQELEPGDVLLIEQQGFENNVYCPVEVDPALFDVIQLAVAKGIHVIEPAGNGSIDLDAPIWNGWFDRNIQDSGAIMVGAGASPYSLDEPRSWGNAASNYGLRIDVQGWVDSTVTVGGEEMSDLFYPNNDLNQAYTAYFGGTSGASAQIASVVALLNSISISLYQAPYPPEVFREMLEQSSLPQPENEEKHLGGLPQVNLFLQKYAH